jgi:hypothetical protein
MKSVCFFPMHPLGNKMWMAGTSPAMTAQMIVAFTLTLVTISDTLRESNLAHEGRLWEVDPKAGASAVPAGGVTTRTRAASGISWPALRPVREVRHWTGTGWGG